MNATSPYSSSTADEHTSVVLTRIIDEAPDGHFTLGWLIDRLPKRSFGVILLFLALFSILPVISIPARILIIMLTFQIIFGYHSPMLPRRLLIKPLPSRYLVKLKHCAIPFLHCLEMTVRPRWPVYIDHIRRVSAFVAMVLTVISLLAPIPLSNVPPAIIGVIMALAHLEHDGLLLTIALALAIVMLGGIVIIV
jgi:hypothetical protein